MKEIKVELQKLQLTIEILKIFNDKNEVKFQHRQFNLINLNIFYLSFCQINSQVFILVNESRLDVITTP